VPSAAATQEDRAGELAKQSLGDLTTALVGRAIGFAELETLLAEIELPLGAGADPCPRTWVGSVGYERFPENLEFAQHLRKQGVERVIDVRELPISRRRGYAKTALSEALANEGIEYLHMKGLGNPKTIRDMFKAGRVEAGRTRYREYLLASQREQLAELQSLLHEKRTALMCLEHDQAVCHREVIIEALENDIELALDVAPLG
jgi:hypothetical protein